MTAPMEFEEPAEIPFSALVRTVCRTCGSATVVCMPDRASTAACTECLQARIGMMPATADALKITPVVRYGTFAVSLPVAARDPFPTPASIGAVVPWAEIEEPHSSASSLAAYATQSGWEVRAQRSTGRSPHATTGKPGGLRDVLSLRFGGHSRTARRAVAVAGRLAAGGTWAWGSIWIWGPDLPPYGGCGVEDLKSFLRNPVQDPELFAEWLAVIRDRRAAQASATKIVACSKECELPKGTHTHRANGDVKPKAAKKGREGAS